MYIQPLYRPPSEAYSAIIQATIGCSHNKCGFCSMYINKKFAILPWDELKKHVDIVAGLYPNAQKVFIADGNALVMPSEHWLKLLAYLKDKFPYCNQITVYATPKDVLRKTPDELKELNEAGLSMVYMGIESGNDRILDYIKKGAHSSEIITAGKKIVESDIKLSVTIISGLGGENYHDHAIDTAKVLNEIQPHYIGMLTLMLEPNTFLYDEYKKGSFSLPSLQGYLQESKLLLETLSLKNSVFRSNHASNYLTLAGTLNADRDMLLSKIDFALSNPNILKPEEYRGL